MTQRMRGFPFAARSSYPSSDQFQPFTPSRHNTHADLLNVDLGEGDTGVLVLELGEVGADDLAGSAPGGPEVDDGGLGRGDLRKESATALANVKPRLGRCSADTSRTLRDRWLASTALVAHRSRW